MVGLLVGSKNQNGRVQRQYEIETAVKLMIPEIPEQHGLYQLQGGCKLWAEMTSDAAVRLANVSVRRTVTGQT